MQLLTRTRGPGVRAGHPTQRPAPAGDVLAHERRFDGLAVGLPSRARGPEVSQHALPVLRQAGVPVQPMPRGAVVPGAVSDHGVPPPIGSRVVALAAALVLCCACALFALFALWPTPPGSPAGLGAVVWELVALV